MPEAVSIYIGGISQPAGGGERGPGGWAAVLVGTGRRQVLSGHEGGTTTGRMELTAAVKGLEATVPEAEVTVYSVDEWMVNSVTLVSRRHGDVDLWAELDQLRAARKVTWQTTPARSGTEGEESAEAWAALEAALAQEHHQTGEPVEEAPSPRLTHLDSRGQASMVDVGWKEETDREAVARGFVAMAPDTIHLVQEGLVKKGDALATARLAGIMGAKLTSQLIPLCHPIPLDRVTVDLEVDEARGGVMITASARTSAKTGVEMEALTAVSVAALTIYDMCKSADRGMRIHNVRLVSKRGGKSGDFVLEE